MNSQTLVHGRLLSDGKRTILHLSCWLVGMDHDPGIGRLGVDEPQSGRHGTVFEETLAAAQNNWVEPQAMLVD